MMGLLRRFLGIPERPVVESQELRSITGSTLALWIQNEKSRLNAPEVIVGVTVKQYMLLIAPVSVYLPHTWEGMLGREGVEIVTTKCAYCGRLVPFYISPCKNCGSERRQLEPVKADPFRYRVVFRPETILPDMELKTR